MEIGENVSDVDELRAMISGAWHGLEDSECAICLVQSSAVPHDGIHAGFVRNRWRMRWAKVHSVGFIPRHVAISSTANALWRVSGLETSSARYVNYICVRITSNPHPLLFCRSCTNDVLANSNSNEKRNPILTSSTHSTSKNQY